MRAFSILLIVISAALVTNGQRCLETARIERPAMSAETVAEFTRNLDKAKADYSAEPNADNLIWYGRRVAYLGDYPRAIELFTRGIREFPNDARMYRHRGHRYISLRCFDEAIRDFEAAAKLIKGKPDEVEPDGLPNARNIPTSTLQSNIWYHLGLAYYLKGDFRRAAKAYEEAVKVSNNPDMLVATKHWQYMTLRRLGRESDAGKAIASIGDSLDIIENDDYYKLIRLYQGKTSADEFSETVGDKAESLGSASLGYGIGNYFLYNGDKDKAREIFRRIVAGNQWSSFGYIAAEAELKR